MIRTSLVAAAAAAALAAAAGAEPIAIVNGLVVTNAEAGAIENGVVLIDGERIVAVGADVAVPDDAIVLDAEGKWVTPGLISPFSRIGLVEIGAESSTDDTAADATAPFNVALDAAEGFNPGSETVAVARRDGITRAAIAPANGATPFAGFGAVVDTSREADTDVRARAFAFVNLNAGGIDTVGGTRPAAFAYLEAALEDAADYPDLAKDDEGMVLNALDAAALRSVVRGETPLFVAVDRATDMRRLAALARRRSAMTIVVVGGAEAHEAAEELAAAHIAVILDPSANLPSSFDAIGASPRTAQVLEAAGVDYAVAAFGWTATNPGYMAQNAAIAVAYGLDWADAFDAVTGGPARILGVNDDLGSLEPGKLADVVVWDGDPLEVMTGAEHVFVAGAEYALRTRQTALRDRYLQVNAERALPLAYEKP